MDARSSGDQSNAARELLRAAGRKGFVAESVSQVLAAAGLVDLSPEQLDGRACAFCGRRDGPMVPISRGLFVHATRGGCGS